MKKLSDIVMELGKVQTDKDNPPFQTPQQIQKVDFRKPTVIHISKKEMEMLHNDGRLETDGVTIIADE